MTLRIEHLNKSFEQNSVIEDISFEVQEGAFISLLGPSGCGKTTLLRLIAGLESPDSGAISFQDTVFYSSESKKNLVSAKRNLGMVFQDFALWPHMNVFENVAYPLKVKKDTANLKQRVHDALDAVQLAHLSDRKVHQLSGGQQQRVSFARAIIAGSKLILMDEPLSALDAALREDMRILLQTLTKQYQMTAIFVTHDQYEAMTMSDEIIVMEKGKIIQQGSPESLYFSPKSPYIAEFIGKGTLIKGTVSNQVFSSDTIQISMDAPDGYYEYLIRPENIELYTDGMSGTITTISFIGDRYEYVIQSGKHSLLFYHPKKFAIGEIIHFKINCNSNYLFRMENL